MSEFELSINIYLESTEIIFNNSKNQLITKSFTIGGREMSNALIDYLRSKNGLIIGPAMAEYIILTIGSALPLETPLYLPVRGRDIKNSGLPKKMEISDHQVREAIEDTIHKILDHTSFIIRQIIPLADQENLKRKGIILKGNYGNIKLLDQLFKNSLGLEVLLIVEKEKLSKEYITLHIKEE